jgi:alpha-tubulin suppressor-like RCC1 family protein
MSTKTSLRGTASPSPTVQALALFAATSFLFACGGTGGSDTPTGTVTEGVVTLSDIGPATVAVGAAVPRSVTVTVVSGRAGTLQWSSDNPAIATVERIGDSPTANVKGIAPGTTTIRATVGGTSTTAAVTVRNLVFDRLVLNGGRHACALTADNTAYCWGDHGEHALGPISDPEICPAQLRQCSTTPRLLTTSPSFVTLAVSHGGNTCGLTADGTAYCWGNNVFEIVNAFALSETCAPTEVNPFSCIATPTRVRGNVKFASLSLSRSFCGLTAQGAAYCWGFNDFGQLGDGTMTLRDTPTPVLGGLTFTSLSLGAWHSCGLTAAGAAYCWGSNQFGQLGDGTTTDRTAPVAVAGGHAFVGLGIAREYSCGVTRAGAVYCWGDNTLGVLGDGTTTSSSVPKRIASTETFVSVTAGLEHACALTTGNRARCWGQNTGLQVQGQLGDGTMTSKPTPVPVARDLAFVELRAGRAFTCGRTADGKIYCWGDNRFGQLGAGMLARNSTTPVGVAGVP